MKLRKILNEVKLIKNLNNDQLKDYLNKNIVEFVEFILIDMRHAGNPEWNYVRNGWIKHGVMTSEDYYGEDNQPDLLIMPDGDDDNIHISRYLPDEDITADLFGEEINWKEILFKNIKLYYIYT